MSTNANAEKPQRKSAKSNILHLKQEKGTKIKAYLVGLTIGRGWN